jgi:hypothetical protein
MPILRDLFGPSREEIWRQLSAEIGADYVAGGGFWKGDKVVAAHGQWTITLDTVTESACETSSTYTRLRAPYLNKDGFRFTVYRKGLFSAPGKRLGMQDVDVGYQYVAISGLRERQAMYERMGFRPLGAPV